MLELSVLCVFVVEYYSNIIMEPSLCLDAVSLDHGYHG